MSRDRDDDRGGRRRYDDDDRGGRSRDDDRGGRGRDRDDDRSERRSRDRDDDRGGRGGSGFRYERRSAEDVRKRSEQGGGDFDRMFRDGVKVYKVKDGANNIRILPPTWKGARHYGLDIHVHYGVGPDRGSYLCLHKMKGEPDPIHEAYAEARRSGDEDYAKDLEAKKRVVVYLIDRDNEKEGVQVWAMPFTVDRDLAKISEDRQTGETLYIDDPENGYDITFDRTGKQDRTKYEGLSIARRSSPLGKDAWLQYAMDNPLPEILQYYSYDHIAKAFGGGSTKARSRDDDRSRDRDDDRGGRDRDREDDRGRDRGGRDRNDEPEVTWDDVHGMTNREMRDLIEQKNLRIDHREAKDDEDLADWICDELGLKKQERRRVADDDGGRRRERDEEPAEGRRRVRGDDDEEESASDRLSRMRRERD